MQNFIMYEIPKKGIYKHWVRHYLGPNMVQLRKQSCQVLIVGETKLQYIIQLKEFIPGHKMDDQIRVKKSNVTQEMKQSGTPDYSSAWWNN